MRTFCPLSKLSLESGERHRIDPDIGGNVELGNPLQQVGLVLHQPLVALFGVAGQQQGLALLVANKGLGEHPPEQMEESLACDLLRQQDVAMASAAE